MTAITRVSDTGQGNCVDHHTAITTTFTAGASTVKINNQQAGAVSLTTGRATCGHTSEATQGSPNVFFENQAVHRIGDAGKVDGGSYTVTSGSPNVFANS